MLFQKRQAEARFIITLFFMIQRVNFTQQDLFYLVHSFTSLRQRHQ